jgi:hypothetical protein
MTEELRIRNYSERTVRSYITSISQLSMYYKTSPDKITKEQVKNYAYHPGSFKRCISFKNQSFNQ